MNLDTTTLFLGKRLVGLKFGRLTVVSYAGKDAHCRKYWNCLCRCGKPTTVRGDELNSGDILSCGCLHSEIVSRMLKDRLKHGCSVRGHMTPEYHAWANMHTRCSNSKTREFKRYGGRGIRVCLRWNDFRNFLADMGQRPAGKTIDRIDNSKGYEPENCRWATPKEQARNTRQNVTFEFNESRRCLAEWSELFNIRYATLRWRVKIGNWPIRRALTETVTKSCHRA